MDTRFHLALDERYGAGTHERVVRLLSQPPDAFLLVPRDEMPAGGTSFVDGPTSRYHVFRNSFDALLPHVPESRVVASG